MVALGARIVVVASFEDALEVGLGIRVIPRDDRRVVHRIPRSDVVLKAHAFGRQVGRSVVVLQDLIVAGSFLFLENVHGLTLLRVLNDGHESVPSALVGS